MSQSNTARSVIILSTTRDPVKGKDWFVGRKLGNCLACHKNSDASSESFPGMLGPSMRAVLTNGASEKELAKRCLLPVRVATSSTDDMRPP